jgi:two-component system nitrogen regulation response regulator NtrX
MEVLAALPWPGNVRELRNIVERVFIMTPRDRIEPEDLPAPLLAAGHATRGEVAVPGPEPGSRSLAQARDEFEKRYVWSKYQECGGNMSRTAEALQVERSNLYRKMKGFGLIPAKRAEGE